MAYARFSAKSRVYVWGSAVGLHCTACRISPSETGWYDEWTTTSRSAMLKHLQEHRQRKQRVPWSATRRLKREIAQTGDNYLYL